ncbi:class A beta-lactamase-related serine hydrolase [Micromonospora sp. CPCC 205371]|nr:class A beta-lactamase-related serine hydrolase [Micromonospora sp. CPCC 205371]
MASSRRRSRSRSGSGKALWALLGVVTVAGLALAGLGLRTLPGSPLAASAAGPGGSTTTGASTSPTPSASPTLPPLAIRPTSITLNVEGDFSWAMIDRRDGKISGSKNMATTSSTASMIKAWIGADYLRRAAENGQTPSNLRMEQLRIMIRDSDNDAAQALWGQVGRAASTQRMIKMCKLTDSKANSNWSITALSSRDTARLGACIADGRAAGKKWTNWLLDEMRAVRGVGDFGIRKAFSDEVSSTIAIKNGWVVRDAKGEWEVNCLAIGDKWALGVMTHYPANLGYEYGAKICQDVAAKLKTPTA